MGYEVLALLVFGVMLLVITKGLRTDGSYNNAIHWSLRISGAVLLSLGLIFALPILFPFLHFS